MPFYQKIDRKFSALSIDCLKPPIGSGNILESIPSCLPRDIGVFPFQDTFYGPIEVLPMKDGWWSIPELPKIRDAFERITTIDRSKLSQAMHNLYASQQSDKQ